MVAACIRRTCMLRALLPIQLNASANETGILFNVFLYYYKLYPIPLTNIRLAHILIIYNHTCNQSLQT